MLGFRFGRRFIRLPKHRQFKYRPMYYDPVIDDLDERVTQIKREMGVEEGGSASAKGGYVPNVKFKRNTTTQKASSQTFFLRMIIMIVLMVTLGTFWLYGWGTVFQFILFTQAFILYVWFRFIRPRMK